MTKSAFFRLATGKLNVVSEQFDILAAPPPVLDNIIKAGKLRPGAHFWSAPT